jgi:hypothetical protein
MVKIINSFHGQSPIASTIGKLGTALFADRSANELRRQQAYALDRENTEMEALAVALANSKGGARDFYADPANLARLTLSGYTPAHLGDSFRQQAASQYGVRDARTDEAIIGAGGAYSSSANAFDSEQARLKAAQEAQQAEVAAHNRATEQQAKANQQWEVDKWHQEPQEAIGPNGQPLFMPRAHLTDTGVSPVMSSDEFKGSQFALNWNDMDKLAPVQQRALGVEPTVGTTWNYLMPDNTRFTTTDENFAEGKDAQGRPMPTQGGVRVGGEGGGGAGGALTNAVETDLQSKILASNNFIAQADAMIKLTEDHPESFGIVGAGRSALQGVAQNLSVFQQYMSPEMVEASKTFLNRPYDPSLPQVAMMEKSIVYSAASALAGQENRSVSDTDREVWNEAMGRMQSFWSLDTAASVKQKLMFAKSVAQEHARLAAEALKRGVTFSPDGSNSVVPMAITNVMVKFITENNQQPQGAPAPVNGRVPPQPTPNTPAPNAPAATGGYRVLGVRER